MQRGDTSIYSDLGGVEHVAVVTEAHTDGTVDLAVLKTSQRNVKRAVQPGPGMFFDPDFVEPTVAEPTVDAPSEPTGLSSVPQEENVESPAHGDPADVEQPEEPSAG